MAIETFENLPIVDTGGRFLISALDAKKISFPNNGADFGNSGDQLRSLGNGGVEWAAPGMPTYEQTEQAISDWLDAHPEATTTVADGAITDAKLNDALKRGLVYGFETVTDMKAADTLKAGMVCHTNGFYTSGDGGAAWYEISATGTANEMDVIACGSLFANLIINGLINVAQYGADTSGNQDSADAIQYAIDSNLGKTVRFPEGRYQLSKTIKSWAGPDNHTDFIFDPNAEFFASEDLQCLFFIGGYNPDAKFNTTTYLGHKYYFIGGRFDGTNCDWAVKMSSSSCDTQFMFCNFINCRNGLLLGEGNTDGGSIDAYVDNCNFMGTGALNSCGIKAMYPDYKINHCRIYGFQTCIKGIAAGAYLFDIHTLDLGNPEYGYSNSCVVDFPHGGRNSLLAVYGNGEGTFLKLNKNATHLIRIIDCEYRNWTLDESDMVFIDFYDGDHDTTLTYSNHVVATNNFLYYDPSTTHERTGIKGVTLPIYSGLKLENNLIWGAQNLTDEGDLILQSVIPQMQRANRTVNANYWYYLGAMKEKQYIKDYIFEVMLGLITFKVHMLWNPDSHTATVFNVSSDSNYTTTPGTYSFGYIYDAANASIKFYAGANVQFRASNMTALVIEPTRRYYLGYKESIFIGGSGSQDTLGGSFSSLTMTDSRSVNLS